MIMAAVMGACRHMAGMRITYEESRTVADNASGSFHSLVPPTSRNKSPVAQPRSALKMRPLKFVDGLLHLRIESGDHRADCPDWIGVGAQPEQQPKHRCCDKNVHRKMNAKQIALQEPLQHDFTKSF